MGYVTIELMIHIAVRISDASTHCPAGAELPAIQCDAVQCRQDGRPRRRMSEPSTLPTGVRRHHRNTWGRGAKKAHCNTLQHINNIDTLQHSNNMNMLHRRFAAKCSRPEAVSR
jgi:hypothetical protein